MDHPPANMSDAHAARRDPAAHARRKRAQMVLSAFLLTFIAARISVFLIMARIIPDLYLHVWGTHIHHLNYGIFLLVAVGAWLLLRPPRSLRWPAIVYGVGLALTFDEFGMWLHLGGGYWQRASWDAVVVVCAFLALFSFGPSFAQYRSRHWLWGATLLLSTILFFWMLVRSLDHAGQRMLPRLQQMEETSPP
jgi:hypothetical protein